MAAPDAPITCAELPAPVNEVLGVVTKLRHSAPCPMNSVVGCMGQLVATLVNGSNVGMSCWQPTCENKLGVPCDVPVGMCNEPTCGLMVCQDHFLGLKLKWAEKTVQDNIRAVQANLTAISDLTDDNNAKFCRRLRIAFATDKFLAYKDVAIDPWFALVHRLEARDYVAIRDMRPRDVVYDAASHDTETMFDERVEEPASEQQAAVSEDEFEEYSQPPDDIDGRTEHVRFLYHVTRTKFWSRRDACAFLDELMAEADQRGRFGKLITLEEMTETWGLIQRDLSGFSSPEPSGNGNDDDELASEDAAGDEQDAVPEDYGYEHMPSPVHVDGHECGFASPTPSGPPEGELNSETAFEWIDSPGFAEDDRLMLPDWLAPHVKPRVQPMRYWRILYKNHWLNQRRLQSVTARSASALAQKAELKAAIEAARDVPGSALARGNAPRLRKNPPVRPAHRDWRFGQKRRDAISKHGNGGAFDRVPQMCAKDSRRGRMAGVDRVRNKAFGKTRKGQQQRGSRKRSPPRRASSSRAAPKPRPAPPPRRLPRHAEPQQRVIGARVSSMAASSARSRSPTTRDARAPLPRISSCTHERSAGDAASCSSALSRGPVIGARIRPARARSPRGSCRSTRD